LMLQVQCVGERDAWMERPEGGNLAVVEAR
jgi:hypothetical protein